MVVGWAMEPFLTDTLTTKVLKMAIGNRQPPPRLLHHSDRGSQYASGRYQRLLTSHDALTSMSGTGNVYDNAPMEWILPGLVDTEIRYSDTKWRHNNG